MTSRRPQRPSAEARSKLVVARRKVAAVLLAPEEFDRLSSGARFVAAVEDGLADLDAGRVVTDDALGRRLDARFGLPAPRVEGHRLLGDIDPDDV